MTDLFSPDGVDPADAALVVMPENPSDDDRAYVCHRLRLSGMPWGEAARMAGYHDARAAMVTVKTWLQRTGMALAAERREEAFDLEIGRLEELHHAFWGKALAGDDKAAAVVLRAMDTRIRLYGLEALNTEATTSRTIIISSDPAQFAAQMEEYVRDV